MALHTYYIYIRRERERESVGPFGLRFCGEFINVNKKRHVFQCQCCKGLKTSSVVALKGVKRQTQTNSIHDFLHIFHSHIRISAIAVAGSTASFQICRDHSKLSFMPVKLPVFVCVIFHCYTTLSSFPFLLFFLGHVELASFNLH